MPSVRRLFDAEPALSAARLIWREEMPAMVRTAHDLSDVMTAVDLIELQDTAYGGLGLFRRDRALWHEPSIMPEYLPYMLDRMTPDAAIYHKWVAGLLADPVTTIALDTPALVPIHPNWIYGHFLLEMLPRALLLDLCCPQDWPMLVASGGPVWLPDILRQIIPFRPIRLFDSATEIVTAPRFFGCSDLISEIGTRSEARVLINTLKARMLAGLTVESLSAIPGRKIYLSRKGIRNDRRQIVNEGEIESAVAELGYLVVRLETLPFADQIALFDNADIVLGEYSSAMHGAVFSRPGTRIICLNWLNGYQSRIATLFGHTVGYVAPADGSFRDVARVRRNDGSMRFDVPALVDRLRLVQDGLA